MKDSYLPKIIIAVIGAVILMSMFSQCSQQAQMQNMYNQQIEDSQIQYQNAQQQMQHMEQQQQMELQQMMQQMNGGYPMQQGTMPPNNGYPPNGYMRSGDGYPEPNQ